ncbi:MAG TPA: MFS transporter [Candidatus Acidoferrales bacterium]|nr:MFS transporter [Candidatus Acidoferrales bacterium]
MANEAAIGTIPAIHTKLSRQQITGFWGAWFGWTLDGMDSVIYALVLSPALTELLPKSGYKATPATVGFAGSILFALFLVGWGLSLIWGPIADKFGRTRVLAATIFVYAIFTGAAALSQTVWQLGLFRLLAGIGIGGEWALAGTYVAEAWPEDRRKMGAGYLQTGYYAGFFLASALNYTVAAHYGWRAMFWCGLTPVVVAFLVLFRVKEPARWEQKAKVKTGGLSSLSRIFSAPYTRRTLVNTVLLASAICGLWAGAVYAPTAIINLAKRAGMLQPQAVRMSSFGMGLLSLGTILGCLAVPPLAERFGRKLTLTFYFLGMAICILLSFGWAFYLPQGLHPFIAVLFFLGFFGGNFAVFSLWLPEQYGTTVRATAFAFTTSFGRFIAAGVNFAVGGLVRGMGSLGTPVAFTAIAFGIGLLVIPFAIETRGKVLPD